MQVLDRCMQNHGLPKEVVFSREGSLKRGTTVANAPLGCS